MSLLTGKETEPDEKKPARYPRSPIGGFWIRALAFVFDLILLHFAYYMIVFLFKEALFPLGRLNFYLGGAGVFLYFCLLNGPVGKGKTLGKMIFNLTVMDYRGQPLSFQAAFVRSVVQLHFVVLTLLISSLPSPNSVSGATFQDLMVVPVLAFLVANAVMLGVYPLKQGFHDLMAPSLVLRDPYKIEYDKLVKGTENLARMRSQSQQSAAIAFIVMTIIGAFNVVQQAKNPKQKEYLQLVQEARQLFAIPTFELVGLGFSPAGYGPRSAAIDKTTSATAPQLAANEGVVVFLYRRQNRVTADEIRNNEKIEYVAEQAGEWVRSKAVPNYPHLMPQGIDVIKKVRFHFYAYIGLYLYSYDSRVAEVVKTVDIPVPKEETVNPSPTGQ